MFELRPGEAFEPSIDVKNRWTFTRKSSFNAAGVELPGLFVAKGFDIDVGAFVAVLFLELWGLYSLVSAIGLFRDDGTLNTLGLGGVVAAFLIDVALAVIRHLPVGQHCRYLNNRVLTSSPEERHRLQNRRGWKRFLAPLGTLLIFSVAAVKVYIFYMLNEGEITGLTISVLVSYLFAAILHVNNTGYFLYGLFFSFSIRKEHDEWLSQSDEAGNFTIHGKRPFTIQIPAHETIVLQTVSADHHEIRTEVDGSGHSTYLLETWGVLTDGQLQTLVGRQATENAQRIVALAGLRAQLRILDAPPVSQSVKGGVSQEKSPPEGPAEASILQPDFGAKP